MCAARLHLWHIWCRISVSNLLCGLRVAPRAAVQRSDRAGRWPDTRAVLSADRMVMADVIVTDVGCDSSLTAGSAREMGAAAEKTVRAKHNALGCLALEEDSNFVALAHESHRRLSKV